MENFSAFSPSAIRRRLGLLPHAYTVTRSGSSERLKSGSIEEEEEFYMLDINDRISNSERIISKKYSNTNAVITSKYSLASFIPTTLFEFFRITANMYFLVISLFQLFTDLNPENSRFTTVGPLSAVLMLSMAKQGLEDSKRHKADNEMNARQVERLSESGVVERISWSDVQVGDILITKDREEFSADCAILASSEADGRCFTETANLDGETNLKRRISISETSDFVCGGKKNGPMNPSQQRDRVAKLKGRMEYEQPNNRLYNFTGRLTLSTTPENPIPVFPDNIVLRGCMLRSCAYVFGLVLFTGSETKIMKNMRPAPLKQSNVYKLVNKCVLLIFMIELSMMIFSSIQFALWNTNNPDNPYLYGSETAAVSLTSTQKFTSAFLSLFTFLMLYANLVPISLYVSMDIIKVVQAGLIEKDAKMIHNNTPARARTSDLNEDLGQIEYIFSDKTGTLTCNMMEFRKCYINGIAYGFGTTEIGRAAAAMLKGKVEEKDENIDDITNLSNRKEAQVNFDPTIGFDDPRLIQNLRGAKDEKTSIAINEFLILLSVCHTVIPEVSSGKVCYRAASPDEEALVKAAKCLGYDLKTAAPMVDVEVSAKNGKPYTLKYEILAVNEFTSTRKRMSSLVKDSNGNYTLYSKGADNVIIERSLVNADQNEMISKLKEFASEGLRTLVCSKKSIPAPEAQLWLKEYTDAMSALSNREEKLVAVAEKIEKDMVIVGCTAIEDKLQDNVAGTIINLAKADIKIWMLTGDKEETAINIAYACGLLNQQMELVSITNVDSQNEITKQLNKIKSDKKIVDDNSQKSDTLNMALIVDGFSLTKIMSCPEEVQNTFLSICRVCKAVVACRVSPAQKAEIVKMVRSGVKPEPMTLAIGDGANDVNMIQTAHVGIGISGQEGVQAVNASDYAISQFKFLEHLLLTHGRNNYRNLCMTILYSFYKNVALVLTLFLFNYCNGQSGSTIYESIIKVGWNVFLAIPILALGCYDKEVSDAVGLKNPILYTPGQKNSYFNRTKFLQWAFLSVCHGSIVFILPLWFIGVTSWSYGGHQEGLMMMGTTIYTALLTVMNLKVAFMVKTWTRIFLFVWSTSFVSYFLFITAYSSILPYNGFYSIAKRCYASSIFWLLNLLLPAACLGIDISVHYVLDWYYPTPVVILREREKYSMDVKSGVNLLEQNHLESAPIIEVSEKIMRSDVSYNINTRDYSGFAFSSPEGIANSTPVTKKSK